MRRTSLDLLSARRAGAAAVLLLLGAAGGPALARGNLVQESDVKTLEAVGTAMVKLYDAVNLQAVTPAPNPAQEACLKSLSLDVRPLNFMVNDLFDLYYAAYSAQDGDDETIDLKMIAFRTKLYKGYIADMMRSQGASAGQCAEVAVLQDESRQLHDVLQKLETIIDDTDRRIPEDVKAP